MKKQIISLIISFIIIIGILASCNSNEGSSKNSSSSAEVSSSSSTSSISSASTSSVDSSSSEETVQKFENPDENPNYQQAYAYYAKKNYTKAIEICDNELKENSDCFWAYNLKGIAKYFANGNSCADECIELINKSVEINEDYYYGYFNRALIEKGTKKWDNSIADFQKVIDLKPDDTWSYYGIATVYADTKKKDETLEYLKLALNLDSENVKDAIQDDMQRHFSWLENDSDFKALSK